MSTRPSSPNSVPAWLVRTFPYHNTEISLDLFVAVSAIGGVDSSNATATWLDFCELVYKGSLTAVKAGELLGQLMEARSGYNFNVAWNRFHRGVPIAYDSPTLRALGYDVEGLVAKYSDGTDETVINQDPKGN